MKSRRGGRSGFVDLMRVFFFSWVSFVASVVGLGACVKTLPYQTVLKENAISKSALDLSAEYLYVPSVGAASRSVTGNVLPFMLGDEKIVKLELTRNSLQAYEMERDANFQGNPQNRNLVFEIPISHVEYRCQKDRLGNCRNQEEEDSSISWDQKSKFKPDFARVSITEPNFLPESIDKLIVGKACMTEISNKPLDYEFGEKHINFRIERTMANDVRCGFFSYLSDLTASMVSNYSLVKLDSLSTKGYGSVNYPDKDEKKFGFFMTERKYADVDNGYRQKRAVRFINRWAPDRSEVVYHLSDEFNKPENKLLKQAAYKVIERANDGLDEAGVQFRFRLNEPAGINMGDMRYNVIALVEDVDRLVGYSPFVVHPQTGEILASRTVLFSGALKQHVWESYEQIREERREGKTAAPGMLGSEPENKAGTSSDKSGGDKSSTHSDESKGSESKYMNDIDRRENSSRGLVLKNKTSPKEFSLKDYLNSELGIETSDFRSLDQLMEQRHFCLLQAQPGVGGFINPKILEAINEKFGSEELRAWEDLSATEKQFLLDLIMPEEFASTLIHELGHSLGLRHNFEGSTDINNFYKTEELAARGVNYRVNSSSVMDYLEGMQGLPVFGKYDIAALRFGYRRQVEKEKGGYLLLEGTLSEKADATKDGLKGLGLKEYKSCTESGLSGGDSCKRFDSGTTDVEIVDSIIRRYKHIVNWYGYRHKRTNLSLLDDQEYTRYILSIYRAFYDLRTFMEVTDEINDILLRVNDGDVKAVNEEIWRNSRKMSNRAYFVDLRQAAIKAGKFLLDVLRTPELTCFIGKAGGPSNEIPMMRQLIELDPKALSCSQAKLPDGQVLLGEVGRFFQDREEKTQKKEDLTYDRFDQIVVHGSWLDKVLAAKFLFSRRLDEEGDSLLHPFDETTGSYLDEVFGTTDEEKKNHVFDLQKELIETLRGVMLNKQAVTFHQFPLADGRKMDLKVPLDILQTHTIPRQLFRGLAYFLNLPVEREVNFAEILGQQMVRQTNFLDLKYGHRDTALEDLTRVGIYKTTDVFGTPPAKGTSSFVVGKTKYYATKDNEVASGLIFRFDRGDDGADKLINEALAHLTRINKYNKDGISRFINAMDSARRDPTIILSTVQKKIVKLSDVLYAEVRDPLDDIMQASQGDLTEPARRILAKRALDNERDASRILKMLPVLDGSQ